MPTTRSCPERDSNEASNLDNVALIIPNLNGSPFIKDCLDSIKNQTYNGCSVIVVDNGSTDDSVDFIRQNYDWVKVVALSQNKGFAGGVNEGLKAALASPEIEYLGIVNNDAVLARDWTNALVDFLNNHPGVGSVQGKVLFSMNCLINTLGVVPLPDGGAKDLGIGLPDRPLGNIEIFGVSGAASLYRRSALDMVGLLDEDFFAYLEDVDLAWRLRYAGWRSYLVGSVVVYHAHSKSAKGRQFKTHMAIRNANYVLIKNLPTRNILLFPVNYLRTRLGSSVTKPIRYDHFTTPLSPTAFVSTMIGANAEALSKLPSMFNKRSNIRKTMKVSRVQALEWLRRFTSDLNHYV